MEITGRQFGLIGLFCLAFLFLPVARGSILLRLIDIPFEHATRYHVWLGHLTMVIFTIHGLFYVAAWALEGRLIQQVSLSIANFSPNNITIALIHTSDTAFIESFIAIKIVIYSGDVCFLWNREFYFV